LTLSNTKIGDSRIELVADTDSVVSVSGLTDKAICLLITGVLSLALVFAMEWVARGTYAPILEFMTSPLRPFWTTVGVFFLLALAIDALLGRTYISFLILAPLTLIPAFVSQQKQVYLSDPLYPTDFLFARQIGELLPVMVKDRPFMAVGIVVGIVASVAALIFLWRFGWKHSEQIMRRFRVTRLLFALPLLTGFASIMDYSNFSWIRDRLQVIPMMWDQKENYNQNGFFMAFLFNIPMANVKMPAGYSQNAIDTIASRPLRPVINYHEKPDVIMVMSESFWDPTALPGVTFNRDPLPTVRKNMSGKMFSPEFGGMTANIEFEALTGFSNAMLPYGSIPYQQYVRRSIPSLATFFKGEGYVTRAVHPFQKWFWNREVVYNAMGFDRFRSAENLPNLPSRGTFVSDIALTQEIIKEADNADNPFFFFAVSLQNHGPYEQNRYKDNKTVVNGPVTEADKKTIASYAEGIKDADTGLQMLMDWAKKRRRETILVFFGDHLPPLGNPYINSNFMKSLTADRKGPLETMRAEHETPLVIWSSKSGIKKDVGSISPSFIPYHIAKLAGLRHPYYTEFLGKVQQKYSVVDRYELIGRKDDVTADWARQDTIDPMINDFRMLQLDIMFGKQYGLDRFFPTHNMVVNGGF
jgi:phosphoglycerol transferase MdoB-like AlkP superfamily enzyme